ncbi:MAG: D-glycero-beta-D-manno-heptose 1-phosphate adenylyltransferase [Candidatus Susulua stagnicola]|nr:D-glycero-beta-D-manno-heptose 1-phosphate adenylyltransferase [Candidatus Susulua stagnicola]
MGKIKNLKNLESDISNLKRKGKTIVFTNGCFDILHLGHLKILKEAKQKGDILVVGLNSDTSIKKIKGPQRPIVNQKTRANILANMIGVDYVILFNQATPYNLIKRIKPDILVKGGDWKQDKIVGNELVKKVYRVKLCPGHSTTSIINKIKKSG